MAFRKRLFKRRPSRRPRRRIFRRPKRNMSLTHFFKRTFREELSITNTAVTVVPSDVTNNRKNDWRLDQLPNYTDFQNLYDTYKICRIKQKFIYDRNSADSLATATGYGLPNIITVNDFNDTAAISTVNEALEYASCKINRLDKPLTRFFRPTQDLTDSISTATVKSRWNETAESDIQHHGLKVLVEVPNNVVADPVELGKLTIYTTYYLAMKTPK